MDAEMVEEKLDEEEEKEEEEKEENNSDKIQQPSPGRWGKKGIYKWGGPFIQLDQSYNG